MLRRAVIIALIVGLNEFGEGLKVDLYLYQNLFFGLYTVRGQRMKTRPQQLWVAFNEASLWVIGICVTLQTSNVENDARFVYGFVLIILTCLNLIINLGSVFIGGLQELYGAFDEYMSERKRQATMKAEVARLDKIKADAAEPDVGDSNSKALAENIESKVAGQATSSKDGDEKLAPAQTRSASRREKQAQL